MTPSSIRSDPPDPTASREAKQLREHFMGGSGTAPGAPPAPLAVPPPSPAQQPQTLPPNNKLKLGHGCS